MSWQKTTLGETVDLLAGFAFKSAQFTDEPDGVRLLRGDNITQGLTRWDGVKRWPQANVAGLERYWLKKDDVVLAMDRPWIEAGLKFASIRDADLPSLLVQRVARLRSKAALDQVFLKYVIGAKAFTDHVQAITTGANVPHISGRDILAYSFELPRLGVQRRIADILSAYDDLIENNTRRIAILEDMARRLFEEWSAGNVGGSRVPFSDLADFINGFAFKPAHLGDTGYPVVKIPELQNGVTGKTPFNDGAIVPARNHINTGDLLFSWSGTFAVKFWIGGHALLNQHLFKVVPNEPHLAAFLLVALRAAMPEFLSESVGATMKHIRRGSLSSVTCASPHGHGGPELCASLDELYALVNSLRQTNINLRTTRELLLPKLISGEIEVRPAEEELEATAA